MKTFHCQSCGQLVFFDNTQCTHCGAKLGYLPDKTILCALHHCGDNLWQPKLAGASADKRYRICQNGMSYGVCNWMVPMEQKSVFCLACDLNHTIPDLSISDNKTLWFRLETAKRHMLYGLLRLGLAIHNKRQDPLRGLAFDFLADGPPQFRERQSVITGHQQGLITVNIAEADDAVREKHRQDMAEPYRTLLGHFRHEIGHYYWQSMVADRDSLESFRRIFGDERQNYDQAMRHYYTQPPVEWQDSFVSRYASAHPLEDWAETWAHYLHIIDTLETASEFSIRVQPRATNTPELRAEPAMDFYQNTVFDEIIKHWLPLTYAVNSINRSMGQPPLYPFVLSPTAERKLRWVHQVIHPS